MLGDASTSAFDSLDEYTLVAAQHLVDGISPRSGRDRINVVVEIPAGTTAKWEVAKEDGTLRWEFSDGDPRTVQYLGYPGNYGIVPRTLVPEEAGGDGDPLDVVLLGPAVRRGAVVRARLLGVLRLLDDGERDDKLLAVLDGTPMGSATDLSDLQARFNGVTSIVETWFTNYKGPGETVSLGYGGVDEAEAILAAAIAAYR